MANQITFQEDPGLAPEHVIDPGLAHDEDDQTLMTAVQELGKQESSSEDEVVGVLNRLDGGNQAVRAGAHPGLAREPPGSARGSGCP